MTKKTKLKAIKRLKIIEGQIRGLQKMINKDTYCVDIINQTLAVKKALSSVEDILLEDHLSTCVIKNVRGQNNPTTLKEILELYKLAKNK